MKHASDIPFTRRRALVTTLIVLLIAAVVIVYIFGCSEKKPVYTTVTIENSATPQKIISLHDIFGDIPAGYSLGITISKKKEKFFEVWIEPSENHAVYLIPQLSSPQYVYLLAYVSNTKTQQKVRAKLFLIHIDESNKRFLLFTATGDR